MLQFSTDSSVHKLGIVGTLSHFDDMYLTADISIPPNSRRCRESERLDRTEVIFDERTDLFIGLKRQLSTGASDDELDCSVLRDTDGKTVYFHHCSWGSYFVIYVLPTNSLIKTTIIKLNFTRSGTTHARLAVETLVNPSVNSGHIDRV